MSHRIGERFQFLVGGLKQGGPVTDAAADGTGQLLAAATRTHVALWDARSGATLHAWNDLARVGSLALSADGQWLAIAHESAGHAAVIRVWDCRAGREHLVLRGHTDHITWLAFSPDSRRLASASYDRTVRLWEPVTGMPAATLFDHGYRVTSVAWSGDGAWLVSGAGDGLVRFRCAAGLR